MRSRLFLALMVLTSIVYSTPAFTAQVFVINTVGESSVQTNNPENFELQYTLEIRASSNASLNAYRRCRPLGGEIKNEMFGKPEFIADGTGPFNVRCTVSLTADCLIP